MAAHSSENPPSCEQATFERATHVSLEAPGERTRSIRRIAVELTHETLRSEAIEGNWNWEFSDDADRRVRQELGTPDQDLGQSVLRQQQPSSPPERHQSPPNQGLPLDLDQFFKSNDGNLPPSPPKSPETDDEIRSSHKFYFGREEEDDDGAVCDDVEVCEPWTEDQLSSTAATRNQEAQRMRSSSSATDTTASERELRRHFGALYRIHDNVRRAGIPWDGRAASPADTMTDDFDVEDITDRMLASCDLVVASHADATNRENGNRGPD